ncbi:MAG: hypothetical protein ABI207_01310 [Crocinitomicaceae bacterium]
MKQTEWVSRFSNDEAFVQKTLEQIEKDAQGYIDVPKFISNNNLIYENSVSWISSILHKIMEKNRALFLQYLYRVDIPEKIVHPILKDWSESSYQVLAKIILEREAQKVFLRAKFSNLPKSETED